MSRRCLPSADDSHSLDLAPDRADGRPQTSLAPTTHQLLANTAKQQLSSSSIHHHHHRYHHHYHYYSTSATHSWAHSEK